MPAKFQFVTSTMTQPADIAILSRRAFLVAGAAAAALAAALPALAGAVGSTLEQTEQFKDAFAKIVGQATPVEGKITVDLPETAENGNFVPVSILVDSPMTDADHVKAIHLLSTGNPFAHVATFRLTPLNGLAKVQTRMRLARTQDVVVLAEMSDGTLAIATTLVKVTIGGCQG